MHNTGLTPCDNMSYRTSPLLINNIALQRYLAWNIIYNIYIICIYIYNSYDKLIS